MCCTNFRLASWDAAMPPRMAGVSPTFGWSGVDVTPDIFVAFGNYRCVNIHWVHVVAVFAEIVDFAPSVTKRLILVYQNIMNDILFYAPELSCIPTQHLPWNKYSTRHFLHVPPLATKFIKSFCFVPVIDCSTTCFLFWKQKRTQKKNTLCRTICNHYYICDICLSLCVLFFHKSQKIKRVVCSPTWALISWSEKNKKIHGFTTFPQHATCIRVFFAGVFLKHKKCISVFYSNVNHTHVVQNRTNGLTQHWETWIMDLPCIKWNERNQIVVALFRHAQKIQQWPPKSLNPNMFCTKFCKPPFFRPRIHPNIFQ